MFSAGSCFSSALGARREALLAGCRTRRHAVVASRTGCQVADADVVARPSQLPIANGAVDAVLLPHTLEFETDPYAVVREADRVLAGEGQLLVLGFRPLSLWGFRSRAISRGFPPGLRACSPRGACATGSCCSATTSSLTRHYLFTPPWGGSAPRAGVPSALLRRGWIKPGPRARTSQGAQARLHADADPAASFRERAQRIGGLVKPTTRYSASAVSRRRDLYRRGLPRQPGPGRLGARCSSSAGARRRSPARSR